MTQENTLITAAEILEIPFYGGILLAIRGANGINYTSPKRIAEALGLDWSGQHAKLKDHPVLGPAMGFIPMTAADGKSYQMCALPVDMVPGWLLNIHPSRVAEAQREALVKYQRDAFRVLAEAFLPKETLAPRQDWAIPQTFADALQLAAYQQRALQEQEEKIKADAPKVEAWHEYIDTDGTWTLRDVLKQLPSVQLGQNQGYEALRKAGVIFKNGTEPYQKYVDAGYFVRKPGFYLDKHGTKRPTATTRVTAKGRDFLLRLLGKGSLA